MPKWHRNKRTTRDQNTCLGFPNSSSFFSRFLIVLLLSDTASGLIYVCMLRITSDTADGLIHFMLRITADTASGLTHLYVTAHHRCCRWLDKFCRLQITTDTAGGLIHLYVTDHCGSCQWLDTFVCLAHHGYCWRLDTSVCYRSV